MKKDKEWLKKEINELPLIYYKFNELRLEDVYAVVKDDVLELIDQLDEPETLSQEWIDKHKIVHQSVHGRNDYVPVDDLQNLLVPKQELPVIPKFVADYIEEGKELGSDLGTAMTVLTETLKDIRGYIKNNEELFARAWLDGFTVGKEQKYYVRLPLSNGEEIELYESVGKLNFKDIDVGITGARMTFTEQEIKDYDPRYLAFKVPAEDVEE